MSEVDIAKSIVNGPTSRQKRYHGIGDPCTNNLSPQESVFPNTVMPIETSGDNVTTNNRDNSVVYKFSRQYSFALQSLLEFQIPDVEIDPFYHKPTVENNYMKVRIAWPTELVYQLVKSYSLNYGTSNQIQSIDNPYVLKFHHDFPICPKNSQLLGYNHGWSIQLEEKVIHLAVPSMYSQQGGLPILRLKENDHPYETITYQRDLSQILLVQVTRYQDDLKTVVSKETMSWHVFEKTQKHPALLQQDKLIQFPKHFVYYQQLSAQEEKLHLEAPAGWNNRFYYQDVIYTTDEREIKPGTQEHRDIKINTSLIVTSVHWVCINLRSEKLGHKFDYLSSDRKVPSGDYAILYADKPIHFSGSLADAANSYVLSNDQPHISGYKSHYFSRAEHSNDLPSGVNPSSLAVRVWLQPTEEDLEDNSVDTYKISVFGKVIRELEWQINQHGQISECKIINEFL